MNRAKKKSRVRHGGLLALALGVAALLAIPVVSAARDGNDDNPGHHRHQGETRHHHHSHHGDREVAGTIVSFDANSGRLTIETRSGDSISGLVDASTKIKCEDQGEVEHHHNRGDDRRGRSGEAEPGDDHGDGDNSGPGSGGSDNSGPGSSGSDDSGHSGHDDNGSGANCTTAALLSGAVVEEADLEIEHGTATFDEIELAN